MKHLLFLLYVMLSSLSCNGQGDEGEEQRCMSLLSAGNSSARFCVIYYGQEDGYYVGSGISGLSMALPRIYNMFQNYDNNSCVELMLMFLCHYYFPQCNQSTDEITPVCTRSCGLLANNLDCSELMAVANTVLEQHNVVPPDDSCSQTHRSYVNSPPMSGNCLSIEDTLNETLPLRCIEVPDETCSTQLPHYHYAPNAFQYTEELSDEFADLIRQYDLFHVCRSFITIIVCVSRFPLCNATTGQLTPICPDLCPTIESTFVECALDSLEGYPSLTELFNSFRCRQPASYFNNLPLQYIGNDSSDCFEDLVQTMPSLVPSPTEDDDSSFNIGIVIGLVLGACVVVLIVIILVMVIRRKHIKKSAKRHDSYNEYTESPSIERYHTHDNNDHLVLDMNQTSNSSSPYLTHRQRVLIEETLQGSRSSQLLEVDQFLQFVKNTFSEVLISVESITKQGLLGKGAFGVVHKGEMTTSNGEVKAVAIKTIKSGSLNAMKDLVAESAIMKTFHHPNVLPLLGVCIDYDDEDVLKIVMPFMANGDLRTYLKDSRVSPNNTQEYPENLSEEMLMKMCYDIAKGMEYLAEKRFIHRDLAARNCMVDHLFTIKIADFGLAKDVYSTEYYRIEKHTTLPVKWMSLESLLDGYFDEKTDVWSYGITCWEIFSLGRLPYPGIENANVIQFLKHGKRLEQPELCPLVMNEIIASTWLENPNQRPTFAMIVQNLSSICNLKELTVGDENSIDEDTTEDNGYIRVVK